MHILKRYNLPALFAHHRIITRSDYMSINQAPAASAPSAPTWPALALALVCWLFATLWMRALAMPDEGRYVGVAWEMLQSHDWLTPTLDGLPYFHKPPLFYWLTAISLKLFGPTEWAARVAPTLGALLASGSSYFLIQRWMSARIALWSMIILATSPFFYGGAQYANHDMLVAGCITTTIVFAADAILSLQAGRAYHLSLMLAWAAAALGLLTKGFIGIVLPGGVIVVWLLFERRLQLLPRLLWWPAPLLFALIAAPWFSLMQIQYPDFLHYFFVYQQFQRFATSGFNNAQPFWFYPAVLVLLNLPWIPLLYTRLSLAPATEPAQQLMRHLLWIWVAVIVVFFSLPQSKLIGYVLPVLPAVAALLAEGMLSHPAWGGVIRWRRLALAFLAASLCIVLITAIALRHAAPSRQLGKIYQELHQPEQALVYVNVYPFDFPFYSMAKQPVIVFEDWRNEQLVNRDNWRKELLDAGRFAPMLGGQVLRQIDQLPAFLCAQTVTWLMVPESAAGNGGLLASAKLLGISDGNALLRFDRSSSSSCK
jgi:4-amino-4-deoxy-L-arabinose transferase-like glycosyltransferase